MQNKHAAFTDRSAVAAYATDTPRKVPGLADLHRMTALLLSEHAADAAHLLIVGAGGGLELASLATARPGWRFTGVDPSPAMLDLARDAAGPFAERVQLIEGTVHEAPTGPFDGATCLLVLHFLDRNERLRTLQAIHRRLRPGARLVVAHHSPPAGDAARWMARSAAFAAGTPADQASTMAAGQRMMEQLPLLTADEEEHLLQAAGFVDVERFYTALSFQGWVASVP
jgi:tRNA (cmo5U34)-methyltransferase